jgi:L-fuconolactonase
MFGSDWPVCLLAASYAQVLELLLAGLGELSPTERADVLGGSAGRIYRI